MKNTAMRTLRQFIAPAAACLLALAPAPVTRAAGEDETLRAALESWHAELVHISSISSDFVQEKHMTLFQDTLTIRGRMLIATNGCFAWETLWPVRYKMVVADGRIRQWDEETDRIQTISMRNNPAAAAIHEQMSAWFSGNYAALTNSYTVSLAAAKPVSFLFVPHAGSPATNYLAAVQVWLRDDGRYLDKLRITERSGDMTDIIFNNTVLNQTLPAAAWDVRHITTTAIPAPADSAPGGSPRDK